MSLLTTRLGLPEVTTSTPAGFRALGNARRESRLLEQTATSPDTLPSDFGCAAAAAQDPNAQNVNLKQTLHTSTPITWRARLVNFPRHRRRSPLARLRPETAGEEARPRPIESMHIADVLHGAGQGRRRIRGDVVEHSALWFRPIDLP
jgi:hypothetical protein